ncbi:MG284/MPN403 family protein [Mycoplasma seminis]|uniref:Uncharacterized protein n=1 Tax=Mycoplasma seminis TaxID=512749 RepID=A0ABY9HA24_9MOLU|nr:hypothetical protein [Mycoplasma seminis]WLP85435.1 hypothetical protein Q8852_03885 [Mycoplasma seminis]
MKGIDKLKMYKRYIKDETQEENRTEWDQIKQLGLREDIDALSQKSQWILDTEKLFIEYMSNIIKSMIGVKEIKKLKMQTKLSKLWVEYLVSKKPSIKAEIDEFEKSLKESPDVFDYILSIMTVENAWIIHQIYIEKRSEKNKEWYQEFFSKTTFYKKRRAAIYEFGRLLFQIIDD